MQPSLSRKPFLSGIKRAWRTSTVILMVVSCAACASVGPKHLEVERKKYNVAIQRSDEAQLLLNLVRLRYRDTPFFLEVSSVSSQFGVESGTTASGAAIERMRNLVEKSLNLSQSLIVDESPTVTYLPLQGDVFVQRILAPIGLDSVVLLANSGWSIERVLRVCAQRMNNLKNAPTASGPTPDMAPDYKAFYEATRVLRLLQLEDGAHLGYVKHGQENAAVLNIDRSSQTAHDIAAFERALKLEPGHNRYPLTTDITNRDPGVISLSTRSFLGALFYLSQSVEVPDEHVRAGKVTLTRDAAGNPFDWSSMLGDLIRVHSGKQRPRSAAVAVPYRGHWFYIGDSDLDSKSTFSFMSQLLALQAGKAPGSPGLILTLPVGGN
jgi:hypothetical protein